MAERVLNNDKIEVHWNTELQDVLGDKQVTGIRVIQNKTSEVKDMNLTGLFLAIGHTPNSGPFTDWVKHDPQGYLVGEPDSSRSNIPGVFLAGDIKDQTYRQAITAAGSGCMAALDAERWLEEKEAGH